MRLSASRMLYNSAALGGIEIRRRSFGVLLVCWSLVLAGRHCDAYGCLTAMFDWWRCSPLVTWNGGYIIHTCDGRCRARNGAQFGECILECLRAQPVTGLHMQMHILISRTRFICLFTSVFCTSAVFYDASSLRRNIT